VGNKINADDFPIQGTRMPAASASCPVLQNRRKLPPPAAGRRASQAAISSGKFQGMIWPTRQGFMRK